MALGEKLAPTDIEEGMRVGVDRTKHAIQIPLPPKIDPSVTMMTVEEKPDVTYDDVGGSTESLLKLREVVELPLLHPDRFVKLGIDPPKGVLLYGPPGTGKTLSARAVANRTDATFIRVIGSELVQKYVGEGARMVRELFEMARSRKACIIVRSQRCVVSCRVVSCRVVSRRVVLMVMSHRVVLMVMSHRVVFVSRLWPCAPSGSFSTKLTQSAAPGSTTVPAVTTKCSGRCLRS